MNLAVSFKARTIWENDFMSRQRQNFLFFIFREFKLTAKLK
jgi:hypothetical protein